VSVISAITTQVRTDGVLNDSSLRKMATLTSHQLEGWTGSLPQELENIDESARDGHHMDRVLTANRRMWFILQAYAQMNPVERRKMLSPEGLALTHVSAPARDYLLRWFYIRLGPERMKSLLEIVLTLSQS